MRQLLALSLSFLLFASSAEATQWSPQGAVQPKSIGFSTVSDTLLVRNLLTQGAAALRGEQWAEAVALFSAAYELAEGEQRNNANFFWAYALYTHGSSIGQQNLENDPIETQRALEFLHEALARLNLHEHRNRGVLSEAAAREIRVQEERLRRGR